MSWIRLRQVALVARDLEAVLRDLHDALDLEVAYRDPAVDAFGLQNAVLPVGTQFIEVVSPTRDGTAGGRQLERLGGDGGYMVICHIDDHSTARRRVQDLGVRTVIDAEDHGYHIMQLHPSDTGGSFLEIDFQPGGEDAEGPWMPAGPNWQRARRTDVVNGITAVDVQCKDPDKTAGALGRDHCARRRRPRAEARQRDGQVRRRIARLTRRSHLVGDRLDPLRRTTHDRRGDVHARLKLSVGRLASDHEFKGGTGLRSMAEEFAEEFAERARVRALHPASLTSGRRAASQSDRCRARSAARRAADGAVWEHGLEADAHFERGAVLTEVLEVVSDHARRCPLRPRRP